MTTKYVFTAQNVDSADGEKEIRELFTQMRPKFGMAAAIPYTFRNDCQQKLIRHARELMDGNSALGFIDALNRAVRDNSHLAYFAMQMTPNPGEAMDLELQRAAA